LWSPAGEAAATPAVATEVKKEQAPDQPANTAATDTAEGKPHEEQQQQIQMEQQQPEQQPPATSLQEQARQISDAAQSLLVQLPEYVDNIGFALTPIDLTTGMPVARSQLINTSCLAALQLLAGGVHASLHGRLAAAAAKVCVKSA
jgi:hypothetical protein